MKDIFTTAATGERVKVRRGMDKDTDGVPWQVRAIFFMGVPSAIACYLVYLMGTGIVSAMVGMQQTMANMVVAMNGIAVTLNIVAIDHGTLKLDHGALKVQNDRMLSVLQATCANAAKDRIERESCFRTSQ